MQPIGRAGEKRITEVDRSEEGIKNRSSDWPERWFQPVGAGDRLPNGDGDLVLATRDK